MNDKRAFYCPNCGAYLNKQDGYDSDEEVWVCNVCHYINNTENNADNVEYGEDNFNSNFNGDNGRDDYDNTDFNDNFGSDDYDNTYTQYYNSPYENLRDKENQREKKFKNESHRFRIRYTVFFTLIIIFSMIAYAISPDDTRIAVGFSSKDCVGKDYKEVRKMFENAGFENIELIPVENLDYEESDQKGKVEKVKVGLARRFDKDDKYPESRTVKITYKSMKVIKTPVSSWEAKNLKYEALIKKMKRAGFKNIEIKVEYDVVVGLLADDGDVKSMKIGEEGKYSTGDEFAVDSKIVITYHGKASKKK